MKSVKHTVQNNDFDATWMIRIPRYLRHIHIPGRFVVKWPVEVVVWRVTTAVKQVQSL